MSARTVGYRPVMSQLPNGESLEHVEHLDQADVRERVAKDPDEQRNREDRADSPDGATNTLGSDEDANDRA